MKNFLCVWIMIGKRLHFFWESFMNHFDYGSVFNKWFMSDIQLELMSYWVHK